MYLPPWARFCLRCPSWGRRRAGTSAIAPAPPRQTRPWPRVTCHVSHAAWSQVITVTVGGSTVSWHCCPHDQLCKESTSHRSTIYISSSVAVVAGAVGRSGPGLSSLHHHSASAGERRGGPRTRPRAAAASRPRQLSLQGRRVTTTLTQPGQGHDKRYQRILQM